jgi:hypothetical protein
MSKVPMTGGRRSMREPQCEKLSWRHAHASCLLLVGRMPTDTDPQSARCDHVVVVQLQRQHRGPATRCQPYDLRAFTRPGKMLTPGLPTRMKHRQPIAGIRVYPVNLDALVFVASSAGQPQIVLTRGASAREGNDMFNGQGLTGDEDGRPTIATAVASQPFQPQAGQPSGLGF